MRAMVVMGLVAATGAMIGCSEKPNIEECWSPAAKQAVTTMVIESVHEAIEAQFKASGTEYTAKTKEAVTKQLALSTTNFTASDANSVGTLFCGASVAMTYTKPEGGSLAGKINTLSFTIQPSEKGKIYFIPNTLPIKAMVDGAK